MDEATDLLEYLTLPLRIVDLVREQLAGVNVELPAFLAQLLAAVMFLLLFAYFVKTAGVSKGWQKMMSWLVATASMIATVSIVVAWVDQLVAPRSHQVVGVLHGDEFDGVSVDLLDYKEEPLLRTAEPDARGVFVISYEPVFSDPARSVIVSRADCEDQKFALRRSHLLGEQLMIRGVCKP